MNALRTSDAGPSVDAERDAWDLFEDPAAIQRWMTDRIRESVERNHGVVIPRGA